MVKIKFCKKIYVGEQVDICGMHLYKCHRLFKNGNLAKRNYYFPVGAPYITTID